MLKLKYLFDNVDLAKLALANWTFDRDTLDQDLSMYRISANAIYPFRQNGNICFLRLAPTEEKLEKNLLGELEFIQYLLSHEYPSLEPIKALSGDVLLKLNTPWGEYYASAFRRVNGIPLERTAMTHDILHHYGKALGKLHALSSEFTPGIKKWSHLEALQWIRDVLKEYNAPKAAFSELDAIAFGLAALPIHKNNYGLTHYDFELDNVFYDNSSNSCWVIDFDDGMYHWFALDIEQVFEALADRFNEHELESARSTFIKAYRTEFVYPEEAEASLPLMRRFIDLYKYARLIRCVAEMGEQEPPWMVGLRSKFGDIVKRIELQMIEQHGKPM